MSSWEYFHNYCLEHNCTLVAVSKTKPVEEILPIYEKGQRVFGENKVQELLPKYEALPKDIEWHLIGHLQSNKVKYIAPFVSLIHSVDKESLLAEINKQAEKCNRIIPVLLQVYIAKEESKFGLNELELNDIISNKELYPFVEIKGLMGMASFSDNENIIATEFQYLNSLFNKAISKGHTNLTILSMGMSGDYKVAISNGSNMIRVGSAIFGHR